MKEAQAKFAANPGKGQDKLLTPQTMLYIDELVEQGWQLPTVVTDQTILQEMTAMRLKQAK